MVGGYDGDERLAVQRLDHDAGRLKRGADNRHVKRAGTDQGSEIDAVAIVEVQCDVGQLLAHPLHDRWQNADRGRGRKADVQSARIAGRGSFDPLDHAIAIGDQLIGGSQQLGTGRRQGYATAGTRKKRSAKVAFQLQDLLTEGRLCHADPCGRAAEMKLFGNRDEQPKLTYVDHDGFRLNRHAMIYWRCVRQVRYLAQMFRRSLFLLIAAVFCIGPATARRAQDDHEAAARIERARRVDHWADAIRDSLVAPRWLVGSDRLVFWDAVGPAAGSWVLVDAARGTRRPVIGPAALRAQLAALTGQDAPMPAQMPFVLAPGDRGLLFRLGEARFRIDFGETAVRRVPDGSVHAHLLEDGIASRKGDRVAVQQGNGFAVFDAAGRTLIGRTGEPDLAWMLPEQPWSPDGRLALWRVDQRAVHHIPIVDYAKATEHVTMVAYAKVGTPIAKAELHIFDPAMGTLARVPLAHEEGYQWLAGWRDDGSALVLHLARDGKRLDLLAIGKDGGVRHLVREERPKTKVADLNFATDGWRSQVVPLPDDGFLWMSERDGWRHVQRHDKNGRFRRQITRGTFPVIRVDGVAADGSLVLTAAADPAAPYDERLYRVSRDGGTLQPIATESGTHSAIVSRSGRHLVDSRSSWTSARVRDLRRLDGTITMRLTTADATAVPATGHTPPEPITVLAADGVTVLHGALHRPFGFDPARRYPIIAYIYGGPFGTAVARTYTGSDMTRRVETLAAAGFVVVVIDVRGSAGRSKAFSDATYGRIGQSEVADYVGGLRQLGAQRRWMDLARVGIHGHSWGGYFAIRAMLTAPDMFTAGYAGAPGALDEDALVNEPDMGLLRNNQAGYAAGSNIALADRLTGPLRIMHGTADINAPFSSSMRLVDALIRANTSVELLAIPGVGHTPEGTAGNYYRDDVVRFFIRTLGSSKSGDPAPNGRRD